MHNKRVANKLVSRRQALQTFTSTFVFLAMSANAYADTRAVPKTQAVPKTYASATSLLPIDKMQLENVDVLNVVQRLQGGFQVPVSFIQAPDDKRVTIDVVNGTANDVLAQIIKQNPAYHLNEVAGRVILMPSDARFKERLEVTGIEQIPRAEAVDSFFKTLHNKLPKFKNMGFALFLCGINIHWHEDPVTIGGKASILTHFVELLASDQTLFFSLHWDGIRNTEMRYLFWFGNVGTSPLSRVSLEVPPKSGLMLPLSQQSKAAVVQSPDES